MATKAKAAPAPPAPAAEITLHSVQYDEDRQGFDLSATIVHASGNRSGREFVSAGPEATEEDLKAALVDLYQLA